MGTAVQARDAGSAWLKLKGKGSPAPRAAKEADKCPPPTPLGIGSGGIQGSHGARAPAIEVPVGVRQQTGWGNLWGFIGGGGWAVYDVGSETSNASYRGMGTTWNGLLQRLPLPALQTSHCWMEKKAVNLLPT